MNHYILNYRQEGKPTQEEPFGSFPSREQALSAFFDRVLEEMRNPQKGVRLMILHEGEFEIIAQIWLRLNDSDETAESVC